MRVPLSWLKEFTPLDADARRPESIAELRAVLDSLGLVVEETEWIGAGLEKVVLARVQQITAIPKADRIRQILVDAGGPEPIEIVCGAWNFSEGDVVPLAPVGAELPNGMVIAERKMRGVTSHGMLCSGRELGMSDDADGLLILAGADDDSVTPGTPLVEHLGITPDVVFDLAVEPNRPDCLSIVGVARDLAARLGLAFSIPTPTVHESGPPVDGLATLSVEEEDRCSRFVVRVLSNLEVIPSSALIAKRLVLCGMRPINAIVDVSNYVMLEFGQPSHPYDLDRLGGAGLKVRLARRGEHLTTLDGEERVLGEANDAFGERIATEDLLICDANDLPVGLAGVMGGRDSEISDTTTQVLLEVAQFDALTIGRTAARLNLRSDASQRFWRGIDADGQLRAADRFCELLESVYADAGRALPVVATGAIDFNPAPWTEPVLVLRPACVNTLLGTELTRDAIASLLEPIGCSVKPAGEDLEVGVPSFRPDITREVDLIEEVARQLSFASIELRQRRSPFVGRLSSVQAKRRLLRRVPIGVGAHEAWTSSLVDPTRGGGGSTATPIVLTNPIVPAEHALRTELLSGLLVALAYNASHRNPELRLFELGHVFAADPASPSGAVEREQFAIVLAGAGDDAVRGVHILHRIFEGLGIAPDALELRQPSIDGVVLEEHAIAFGAHPTRSALLFAQDGQLPVGVVGEVDPDVAASFGLRDRRIGWFVIDTEALFDLPPVTTVARPVSHFPSSDIDLAFVVDESVAADRLQRVLADAAGPYCEFVRLVDVYRGAGIKENARSLAYRLRFCAPDHTLEEAEITELRSQCITAARTLGAELRA